MTKYRECLTDISLALKHGYPDDLRYKLYDRRGKCYLKLKDRDRALDAFASLSTALDSSKLSDKDKTTWRANIAKLIKQCKSLPAELQEEVEDEFNKLPCLTHARSTRFPKSSEAMDAVYKNEKEGRTTVAKLDIKIGDVISIEKPFSAILFHNLRSSNCHHCFARVLAPLGCNACADVRFCSEQCRDDSWNEYHETECKYLKLFQSRAIGHIGHLAFRTAVRASFLGMKEHAQKKATASLPNGHLSGFNEELVYGNDYNSVYNLVTHSEGRTSEDHFRFTVVASVLTKILSETNFFGAQNEPPTKEDINFVSTRILRHMQIVQCNTHEALEIQRNGNFNKSDRRDIGMGLYPTAALSNHSCNPNIDLYFYGRTCVTRAIRDIGAGEAIQMSYGPVYHIEAKGQRQKTLLEIGFFTCQCEACEGDWPQRAQLEHQTPTFKCERCATPFEQRQQQKNMTRGVKCRKCEHTQNIQSQLQTLAASHDKYMAALTKIYGGDVVNPLKEVIEHLRLLDGMICHPWKDYISCHFHHQEVLPLDGQHVQQRVGSPNSHRNEFRYRLAAAEWLNNRNGMASLPLLLQLPCLTSEDI